MNDWRKDREKIIGLGEDSYRKSYYPELQDKLKELETAHINMKNILASMADAVIIHDDKGVFKYLNQQAYKLFNISSEEHSSLSIESVSAPDMDIEEIPIFLDKVKQESNYTIEWSIIQRGTLKIFPLQVNMSLIEWNSKPAVISVLRDFSERKSFERELINAKHKAEESDRLKSAFLANVSHEIRTPMNGILGFSDLLRDDMLSHEDRLEYIEIINKGGNRLLNIINQVMDISKIESGSVKVNMNYLSLKEKFDFYASFFSPMAESKGLELHIKYEVPSGSTLLTDIEKFDAIITNLIQNAIKYSISGTIELGCEIDGEFYRFYVKDEGIGIPEDRHKAIFERFVQADLEDKAATQGVGLGLAISAAYLELFGSSFQLKSSLGVGSEFSFKLRNKTQNEPLKDSGFEVNNSTMTTVENLKILIVEDDETSVKLLKTVLKDYTAEFAVVRNGLKAVELLKTDSSFDIVFMDIRLPGINGFDASKEIRKFNSEIIIIAQTAHALAGDRLKALDAGCDDYLPKPINLKNMRSIINKYVKH